MKMRVAIRTSTLNRDFQDLVMLKKYRTAMNTDNKLARRDSSLP